jgi:integrase
MNLKEFVENIYLPTSTSCVLSQEKGIGKSGRITSRDALKRFDCVSSGRWMRAGCSRPSPMKTISAKNEGAFDGVNPVQDARIPRNAREARETFAYNLTQIHSILNALPSLPKAVVAAASFAGLREGELRGLEWPDFAGDSLVVNRSVWKKRTLHQGIRSSRNNCSATVQQVN